MEQLALFGRSQVRELEAADYQFSVDIAIAAPLPALFGQVPEAVAIAHEIIHHRLLRGPYRDIADFQQRLQLSPEAIAQRLPILRF